MYGQLATKVLVQNVESQAMDSFLSNPKVFFRSRVIEHFPNGFSRLVQAPTSVISRSMTHR